MIYRSLQDRSCYGMTRTFPNVNLLERYNHVCFRKAVIVRCHMIVCSRANSNLLYTVRNWWNDLMQLGATYVSYVLVIDLYANRFDLNREANEPRSWLCDKHRYKPTHIDAYTHKHRACVRVCLYIYTHSMQIVITKLWYKKIHDLSIDIERYFSH